MKKLSNFKDSKVDLKNLNGGKTSTETFSFNEIMHAPGGYSTPGNYIVAIGTDFQGSWTWVDVNIN